MCPTREHINHSSVIKYVTHDPGAPVLVSKNYGPWTQYKEQETVQQETSQMVQKHKQGTGNVYMRCPQLRFKTSLPQ